MSLLFLVYATTVWRFVVDSFYFDYFLSHYIALQLLCLSNVVLLEPIYLHPKALIIVRDFPAFLVFFLFVFGFAFSVSCHGPIENGTPEMLFTHILGECGANANTAEHVSCFAQKICFIFCFLPVVAPLLHRHCVLQDYLQERGAHRQVIVGFDHFSLLESTAQRIHFRVVSRIANGQN